MRLRAQSRALVSAASLCPCFCCLIVPLMCGAVVGTLQDTASRMVSTDMPLYTPCYAHGKKSVHAQVMRAYVVTPAHSARVRLCPRVRPVASPCPIFSPGIDGVELPAGGVWVLRFPYPLLFTAVWMRSFLSQRLPIICDVIDVSSFGAHGGPATAIRMLTCRLNKAPLSRGRD